jgi:hypothetical protein
VREERRGFLRRVLRMISGPKREEDHGENCIMMNFTDCILHLIFIVRARMGDDRGIYRVLVGRAEGRDHWEDQDVGGRITLRWTLGRFGWLRIGSGGGICEHGNEPSA